MPIYHKHHIIPKHMGGTNDPSNLVTVTVEEHANLHKQLWEDLGHWEDKVAWLALSNQIVDEEIRKIINEQISQILKEKYRTGLTPWNKGKIGIYTKETKDKMSDSSRLQMQKMTKDEKEIHSLKSGKGAKWYNNGIEEKWIRPGEDIPYGWILGRKKFKNETIQKLKKSHLGQIPWNKGLTEKDPRVASYVNKNRGKLQ
jgi:hypothetical protein